MGLFASYHLSEIKHIPPSKPVFGVSSLFHCRIQNPPPPHACTYVCTNTLITPRVPLLPPQTQDHVPLGFLSSFAPSVFEILLLQSAEQVPSSSRGFACLILILTNSKNLGPGIFPFAFAALFAEVCTQPRLRPSSAGPAGPAQLLPPPTSSSHFQLLELLRRI